MTAAAPTHWQARAALFSRSGVLTPGEVTLIDGDQLRTEMADSRTPLLIDVYATWCGPCKMIGPSLEEISEELGEKVTIAKLNIDENPDAPGKYGVRGIPTMILFKGGSPAATKVGAEPKGRIKAWLEGELV